MNSMTRGLTNVAALGVAGLAALTLALAWPNSGAETSSSTLEPTPAWFAPIAKYYGDAGVTPRTDFASLYTAEQPEWFKPIARYYGGNPRVGSTFDFASLYAGESDWFAPIAQYYSASPSVSSSFDFASLYSGR